MKDIILYFEDDSLAEYAVLDLKKSFPNHGIIHKMGGLKCIPEVLSKIGSIERIAIVCADGNLFGGVLGWDLIKELRQEGYDGPALYTGATKLPDDMKHLFVDAASKEGSGLVNQIKKYLK